MREVLQGICCSDVLAIIREVRRTVHQVTGFWLMREVPYVASDGRMMPPHEVCGDGASA